MVILILVWRYLYIGTVHRLIFPMKDRFILYWFWTHYDDVIKWKHFPCYWPFVRGIHRSPVNSPHKGQWRWALMFSLICVWINGWVNNREAGDLRRYRAHYNVTVMLLYEAYPQPFMDVSIVITVMVNHYHRWMYMIQIQIFLSFTENKSDMIKVGWDIALQNI